MRRIGGIAIGMVATSLLVAAVVPMLLPESAGSRANADFATQAMVTLTLSTFAVVSAILFLLGLRDFKTEFKKTYYLICTGIGIQALALLVYPTAIYLDVLGSSFTSYGGDLFYAVGAVFIFAGLVNFARLLKLTSVLAKTMFVIPVSVGLSALLWLVPHSPVTASELYFNLTKSLISAEGIVSLLCALLVLVIRRNANRRYGRPLMWLALALCANTFGEVFYYAANHLAKPDGTPHADLASASGVIFLLSRILYILAAYSLILMTRKEEARQDEAKPIDVIVYMASLASNLKEVDSLLDELRVLTVAMAADKQLTPEQLNTLRSLYYKLEDYLITKEPLLSFTKESLRSRLEHKFGTLTFVG